MKSLPRSWMVVAIVLIVAVGLPAVAQVEDRLIARDGDLTIYRTEDGKVKITRDGAGDEEWVVVVDPERRGRLVMRDVDIDRELTLRVPTPPFDMEWEGAWPDGVDREEIIIRMRDAEDLADRIQDRVAVGSGPLAFFQQHAAERREVAEKEREASRLAREWRRAETSERARLEADLDRMLEEIFEAKEEARKEELARLNERAKDLEARAAERQHRKAEIISRRKNRLLGEDDPLAW